MPLIWFQLTRISTRYVTHFPVTGNSLTTDGVQFSSQNLFNFHLSLLILILFLFFILGTDFSSIIREGKLLRQTDPTDNEAPWASADGETSVPSFQVAAEMQHIGQTLAVLQMGNYLHSILQLQKIC